MPRREAAPLRQHCRDTAPTFARFIYGANERAAIGALCRSTSLGGRLGELVGRSVLLATHDQLTTALALIELDGVARRMVLSPPDLPSAHLGHIIRAAAIDAVVWDGPGRPRAVGSDDAYSALPLRVVAGTALTPWQGAPRGDRQTEWLLLTSGTVGAPKLVRHDAMSLAAPIKSGGEPPVWGTFYDIRRYGGLQIFFRALLGRGSLVLSCAGEPIEDHLARLAACGVTHLSGTPSHWRRALMSEAAQAIAPRHVRLSGEIADQAILDRLRAFYPAAAIAHAYASTEAGVGFEVDDGLAGFPARLAVIGQGEVDIRCAGGVLALRSARTASCYVGDHAALLRDAEGFVDTGDVVELRGERYYFVGRTGGIINVGGNKVHPEEVEAAINRHPDVAASLVRARRSAITGALVVADVVLKDESAAVAVNGRIRAEIDATCRRELAPHKVPAVLRFVPALDLSAAGKLVRHA